MKMPFQNLLNQRTRNAGLFAGLGLLLSLAGIVVAQEPPIQPQKAPAEPAQAQYTPIQKPSPFRPVTTRTVAEYSDPVVASAQVHLEVLFAVVPDEILIKWAIPHKAIIKRVASNESRPAPLRRPAPAASRQFSLLFGSETPVPLLFDAELCESLLTELKNDTRTNILAAPSVMTTWGNEASIKTDGGKEKKSPLSLKLKPTPIGKGELGLVIDAEVSSTPGVPGGKKSHWNLRARAGHALMLPLAQPDLEKQLVLFVVPKIIAEQPVTAYRTPQYLGAIPPVRYLPKQNQTVYPQPDSTVPSPVYERVPTTRYQPVPQTSYRPVARPAATSTIRREFVAISADFVVATAKQIPERTVEFNPEQRKSWLKSLTESRTAKRQQISTTAQWGKATRLTAPRVKGSEAPFDLKVTPKKGKDGQIILDVDGGINILWPDKDEKIGLETTLKTKPNTTVLIPLPIHDPDGRHVALLIQPSIIASSPAPVAPPQRAVAGTPEKDVATLQMLILDVDSKIAREVAAETRTNEEKLGKVDIQLPTEKGSKKPNTRKRKVETRSFLLNSSLGKLFIADLKKQDDSFKVVSRPQVRTLVGMSAAMEIHGGKDPAKQVAGVGTLKMFVTPKEIDGQLFVKSRLTLLGPGKSLPSGEWTEGLKVEAESTQRAVPGETAVLMIGGKESKRTIVLLTDLVHLEKGRPRPAPPVAQVLPVPQSSTADQQTAMQEQQRRVNPYAPASKAPASTNMRLVTLQTITGSGVSNGDTVDVLMGYAENGDVEKAKVEMLCESVKVYESTRASYDSTTSVTLLVSKDQVEKLLLGQLKGTLRLSLHKSTVQHRYLSLPGANFPTYSSTPPIYGLPGSPYRGPIVYRENGTRGPPDSPIQASGLQSAPVPLKKEAPKSEVQQVLEEVREMRKMIQGLREDMNQLRNSVRPGIKDLAPQTDLWLPKGSSQTVTREKRIIRVDGFDPDIVGVHAKSPNSVVVFGHQFGRSTVKLFFEGEDKSAEEIVVAVVTERPIGDLPMLTRPKAADREPPLPGARHTPLKPIARPRGPHTDVRVAVHRSHRVHRDRKFSRIAVAAPEIADFAQYSLYEAGIIGKKAGRTDLTIWYEDDPTPETFEIVVVGPSDSGDPFSSTGSKEEDAARRRIEQALNKTVSIDMDNGTLKDALKQLHEAAGVNIAVDAVALEEEGVTADAKVSLHLSEVSLRSALKILLSPFNLTTLFEDEVLKVTSQVRAQGAMVAVVYQVRDLIQTDKDGKADFDSLIELITSVVEPDSWQEVGGMGAVAPNVQTMSLVVRQTQDAHEEIQQLFSALRKWNPAEGKKASELELKTGPDQKDLKRLRATDWSPKPKRNGQIPHPIRNPLERTISVSFEDTTLKNLLSHVASAVDVQLVIDREAIETEGVKESSPVSINVDGIMAKSVLNLVLEPLKLGAVLEGEKTLKVTSQSQIKSRQVVRVYSVKHLINDSEIPGTLKEMADLITDCVEPDSWQALGGEATIAPNEKTQSLVIRQTEQAHDEVAELLEACRKRLVELETANAKKPGEALPKKPPGDVGAPIAVPRRR